MAQLKDTIVSGNLRVTDTTLTDTLQVTTIKAPTSSGGSTYGPGTSGQVLKSNGTTTYWGDDNNSSTVLQSATTTSNFRPLVFGTKDTTTISSLTDTVTGQLYTSTRLFFQPSSGNLYMYSPSGDSPALIFQRGTFIDNNLDWKMYDTGGALRFAQAGRNTTTETWSTVVEYKTATNSASTPATRSMLGVYGTTYGNTAANMLSGTAGVFQYGDGGPQIDFSTAPGGSTQSGALIFTDNDTAATGASWHFVSTESDWNVTSKRFHARSGISIGTDKPNTSYNLYVNGTTNITGNTTIGGTLGVTGAITQNGNQVLHAGNYTSYTYSSTASRTANYVLAAPNGSAGAATFRKLVAADLPSHTHQYAGSASVGGPASLLAYGHTNEINISGGKQSTCYFNYRDADTDAQDEGETPVSINYKFCNYRNSTANTTITAANFAGNATSANTLTLKSLAFGSTLNTTTGLFAYTTTGSIYGTNAADWTGIQIGSSADRFQIMGSAGSTVLIRTNDNSDGNISTGWSKWAALMTPASVVVGSGLTKTYGYFDGTADSDIIINATIGHSNSVTAQSTTVFKKFSYDACGHITGVADVSASDLPSHTHNYVPNTKAGVNAAINLLDTGSSTPVDGDYYISQYVNGGTTTTTYHRRPMSALASYVRTKLSVTSSGSGPVVTGMSYSSSTGVLTYTKGRVLSTAGGQWISGRDNAPVLANSSSSTANGFYPMGAVKTNTGAWSIGALGNGDSFAFSFSTDTNYSGGVNTTNNYYIGTDGAFTGTAAGLTTKAITAATVDTTPGSFVFGGTNIIGGINDWVGFQADAGNDRFQIIANSQLVFRQNDSTTIEGNWDPWLGCITPNNVSGDSGITITKITTTIGTGTTALTYDSGVKISHTNSIAAQTSEVFKKFKYDAQGHITGVSAVAAADITALGIPAQDTTYSAGNHLSLSSTTFSLASYCKTITDWNDAKTTGWYMGASVTNAPSTAWWMGRVTAHNAKYCIQEVWQFTASTDGHKVPHKMRMYVNEVWGNWVDITVGTAVPENAVFTDTKVTSSTNHYTPATASGSDISKSASGATAAWSIDVVKGITLNTDGKGHVTGISVTSGKIPGNPVPSNNVTGSGTSGYLAKWNGTNTITQGPLIGTSTTTFLRNDGTWATPDNLASKALTASTFGSTSGNFFFKGDALFGGTDNADWVGIQGDASNDKFQLVAGGGNGVFFRESDDTWGEWHSLLTNNMISGSSGITVTQRTIKIGGDDGTTINAGVTISHTNSITPVPTNPGFYKFKFDAQGHITETAAVAKADITTLGIPGSDTKYGISGAYGSGNKTWVTTLTAGGTGTTSTVPTASTSVYGITKLYNGVDSTSTELAATANAVKTAYDKGNHSHPYLSNTTKYALSSSVGGPALTQLTEALSDTTSSHATVLQTYFTNNVSTVTRNQQLAFYSRAYSNGSMYMGYFLSSYDENPYGGFFVAHYNDPYYVGIKGGTFTQYPLLTQRTLTPETMDTVTGSFVFKGEQLLGDIYDWAGLQVDAGNDAFQMTINSTQLIIRQNDTSTKTTENWGSWRGCLTPANVSGSGGITVTENDTTIGSGASALTYKGSVTISHSNSITAQTSTVFKKFSYDANGHITGVDTVAGTDLPAHTHTHSKGGTWIKARDNPNIYVNPPTNSGSYYPAIFAKTKDGGWSMGVLGGSSTENVLYVTYTTDANYNADNNTNTYQISFPKDGGTLALTKDYVAKSGDTMTGLLTMYREGTTVQDYPAGFKSSVKDTTTGKTYSDAYIYAYQDHAANSYGTNMVINPGGCIFIGAGESAGAHYSAIKSNLATSEYMYLTADTGIYIQGNGGTIANRKGLYIDTGQNIVPSVADTLTNNVGSIGTSDYRWANVYATQLNGKLGQYISTGRPTSANLTTVGDRTVQLIQATSSMTTAKPSTDGYILNFDWDNAGNYQSQLFLANNVGGLNHIQVRAQGGSATWENSKWVTLLSERNSPAFNRIFDRYYRTPASTGWVRILTIGSTNNNGRVYGMSKITISRTWSNNPPEIVSFEVIHNYNTSPNIYFSKSLQQTSSTKVFTNIRIVKSSDGKEQYVDIYHNVSSQNYISIRYEIFEPYDMLDVNNGFPITTPSDGTTLSVLSTTPASADIMRASVAIPSQYDNNFIYANSYWGFAHRDGTTTAYMRTTSNGLLPYQSGNVGSGHSNIGTSSWYFSNIYVDTVNTQQVKIKGTGTYDGTISNANATADRTVILPDSSGVIALMNVILDDAQGVTEWDFSLDANLYRSFIIEVIMPGYTTQTVTVVAHKYYPTAPSSFTMHSSKATSASSYNILPAWIGLCYNTVDTSTPTWQFSVGRASKAISLNSSGGIASVNVPNTDKIKMTKIIGLTN